MNDKEVRRYEMFTRVRDFGATAASSFQSNSLASELFAIVNSVVNELANHSATKSSSDRAARQGTANKAILRAELREDLMAISRTARAIESDLSGFEDKFRVPRNLNDQSLLSTARGFAADSEQLASEFARHELPANFLEEFRKKINLFEKVASEQNLSTESRVIASTAIDEAIDRGMDAVRRLDVIVKNKFSNDPLTLSAWGRAKHTQRQSKPAVTDGTPEPAVVGK